MTKNQWLNEFEKYPEVFKIDGDIVEFNQCFTNDGELGELISKLCRQKPFTALLDNQEDYDAYRKNLSDTTIAEIKLVKTKISTSKNNIDVLYGDVLWANMNDNGDVKLILDMENNIDKLL